MRQMRALCAAVTFVAGTLAAQEPKYRRDLPDSLKREAKVSEAGAIAVAKKLVPRGEIASLELELEGGRLIYSMDVKTPNAPRPASLPIVARCRPNATAA